MVGMKSYAVIMLILFVQDITKEKIYQKKFIKQLDKEEYQDIKIRNIFNKKNFSSSEETQRNFR